MFKVFSLVAPMILAAQFVFAGPISGNYSLKSDCVVRGTKQSFSIPAGKILVTENIPIEGNESIILQANGATTPVLVLGVGQVDDSFRWGPIPFSVGNYANGETNFMENYFKPTTNGGVELLQTVRLVTTANGLAIIATNAGKAETVACGLTR